MRFDVINGVFKQNMLSWDVETCRMFGGSAPIFRIRQSEKAGLLGSEGGDIILPQNFSTTIYQFKRYNVKEILNFQTCNFFDRTCSDSVVAGK